MYATSGANIKCDITTFALSLKNAFRRHFSNSSPICEIMFLLCWAEELCEGPHPLALGRTMYHAGSINLNTCDPPLSLQQPILDNRAKAVHAQPRAINRDFR